MIDLWLAWRGGGFGAGHLPFAGGTADQPACVMASLRIMEGAATALKKKPDGGAD